MFSWKTLRTLCMVLLLLPVAHLVYLVSRDTVSTLDASPDAWAKEIDDYARQDRASHLPENPIVVVGGRRVKLWPGLEDILAPHPVLMRGLGDAIVEDIQHHYERLVGYYRPEAVVFLPSNSEFHIRDTKDANVLVQSIRSLAELDSAHGITRQFYVITPIKTPLHPGDGDTIDEATRLLAAWTQGEDHVTLLDANALLTDQDGLPRAQYFRADGVNLNEHGYLRLSLMLQIQLEQDQL